MDAAFGDHASPDEQSPLLPRTVDRRDKRKRWLNKLILLVAIMFAALVTLVIVAALILPKRAQSYVEKSLQVNISSITVVEVNHNGANLQVDGNLFLNETPSNSKNLDRRLTSALLDMLGPIQMRNLNATILLDTIPQTRAAVANSSAFTVTLGSERRSPFNLLVNVNITNADKIGNFAADVLRGDIKVVPLLVNIDATIHRWVSIRRVISRRLNYELTEMNGPLPDFNITSIAVQDSVDSGVVGQVALETTVRLPVDAAIPSANVQISIAGCGQELITLATGQNLPVKLHRNESHIAVRAIGECREIPTKALAKCKDTPGLSPVDRIMQQYLAGNATTVYISGIADGHSWIQDLLAQVSIPVDIPGTQADQLARDIELSNVKFNLPSFLGGGGKPKISGKISGVIDIPADVEVGIEVESIHVLADLLYKKRKFATIESPGWAPATSRFRTSRELQVEVVLRDAPVTITNQDIFSAILSELLGGNALVDVTGKGDVRVETSLGQFEAHKLPIEAQDIEIGGFGFLGDVRPEIKQIGVSKTTLDSMELTAIAVVE